MHDQRSFDPVTLEIMWRRLINIAEETWVTIWRTSFSTIMAEAQDFGCELMDAAGNSLAHSPRSMPAFNLSLPRTVRALLSRFPVAELRPGDVLITNDPWMCAGHLYDVAVVTPVFHQGRCVALTGSIGHVSDIGGTKERLTTREVYEEGIQIPSMKLYREGVLNQDLVDMIKANVRRPDMVLGDIHALVSSNAVGARRLGEFLTEYGLDDLTELGRTIQDYSERAMRKAVQALPDGTYRYEMYADCLGDPQRLPVQVTVEGDQIVVDYEGAPPQLQRGALNCTENYTAAETVYALKCLLTPEIPSNAGCYKPFLVKAPAGSILNCSYPAPVGVRHILGDYISPLVIGALAEALPLQTRAATGFPTNLSAYGRQPGGQVFNDHMMNGGGSGAWHGGDGISALLFPTSAATVSAEMFELRTPVVLECKELVADSGGAGKWRGGLGQRLRIRKLYDDGSPTLVAVQPEGRFQAPPGVFGGMPGGRCRAVHVQGDGTSVDVPMSGATTLRHPGEEVLMELTGGAGYGDPLDRDPESVLRDVAGGYVSINQAAVAYGVAIRDGQVDATTTKRLRREGSDRA